MKTLALFAASLGLFVLIFWNRLSDHNATESELVLNDVISESVELSSESKLNEASISDHNNYFLYVPHDLESSVSDVGVAFMHGGLASRQQDGEKISTGLCSVITHADQKGIKAGNYVLQVPFSIREGSSIVDFNPEKKGALFYCQFDFLGDSKASSKPYLATYADFKASVGNLVQIRKTTSQN